MLDVEILEFIGQTYWSKDYLIEKDGRKKIAKFVKEGLITNPEGVILRSELAAKISGLLVPEKIVFDKTPVLIYDLDEVVYYDNMDKDFREFVSAFLLNVVKNVLHIPNLYIPVVGLRDIVRVRDDILLFLPMVQNYSVLETHTDSLKDIYFLAPEALNTKEISDRSTLYAFGKIIEYISNDETILRIAKQMSSEEQSERKLTEDIPYFTLPKNKRALSIRRIIREQENIIMEFINSNDKKFLGVIGPQRIGKTTIIENIENTLRESSIHFLHAQSASDVIVQTLQIVADSISKELFDELSRCIEHTCKIDTVSLAIVEAFEKVDKVVIIIDDYHEVQENLKALVRKIVSLSKKANIKVVAFSVEDSKDFEEKIHISAFSIEQTRKLLEVSFGKVHEIELLSQWLTNVSGGLPGVIVEYLKYLYDNDVIFIKNGELQYDLDKLEQVQVVNIFDEKLREFYKTSEKYVAVLGQKFTKDEIEILQGHIDGEISLSNLMANGILYKEYDKYRFTLKHYWELLYNSIDSNERKRLHETLSQETKDTFKRAWHLEAIGQKLSAAVVYLKSIKEMLSYYSSPSLIKSVMEKVKDIIGDRVSYALVKFEVELLTRTEEINDLENLSIPKAKLYSYYIAKKFFFSYKEEKAYEILKEFPTAYGPIGEIRKKLLLLRVKYEVIKKREDYFNQVSDIITKLKEDNPIHADILVDAYFFAARLMFDNPQRAIQYLKKAESISLNFNFAHKLPSIYNNLAVESSNTHISMMYLQRAVDIANDTGFPAKGYLAKLNILYHKLYSGKISEFISELSNIRPRLEMLGLTQEIIYSNSLEAYYHAYNFELESAFEHIAEVEKIKKENRNDERALVSLIARDYDLSKRFVGMVDFETLDAEQKKLFNLLSNIEHDDFGELWESYVNQGSRIFREELCAIFGQRLAKLKPDFFRKELEYLENRFVLDGSLLSLALVYEGYGHYYNVLGKQYKAKVYYMKAITIYKDIGLSNAALSLAKIYDVTSYDIRQEDIEDTRNLSLDILTSLKVIDPKTDPQILMDYFVSKIISVFPVKNVYFKIYDKVLDRSFESGLGEFSSFEKDYISIAPLEIYLSDNFDQKARYEIYISNPDVSFSEGMKDSIIAKLEIIEYGFVGVFKGLLTRLRSFIDPLTKLFTRYYFSDLLSQYFENAVNQKDSLSIVMCDIDNFKKINDTYGHIVGDKVLITVAKILRENIRTTDVVGRFGGEEFIMAFPSTDVNEVTIILERLRRLIRDSADFPFKITLSFGVVSYPQNVENILISSPEELIKLADTALYHAKNTGKDKIVVYAEGMTGGLHA
ncbi:MAG: diguanylate cyclase [Fervidobacterium sp.]